jgi:hypothetical protein
MLRTHMLAVACRNPVRAPLISGLVLVRITGGR